MDQYMQFNINKSFISIYSLYHSQYTYSYFSERLAQYIMNEPNH